MMMFREASRPARGSGTLDGECETSPAVYVRPAGRDMTSLTFTIEPDEFLGLSALVELDRAAGGDDTDTGAVSTAKALMRTALADKLEQADLPWAPSAEAAGKRAAEAAVPASALRGLTRNGKARKAAVSVAAAALVAALWGGYIEGWQWTGFRVNGQLWDWLSLLLFPVVLGTIPLWIQDKEYIGKGRCGIYAIAITAWTGLVIAGYLIPLNWTGFRGQTLWGWLNLLVLPTAVTTVMALTTRRARRPDARLRLSQMAIIAALAAGWIVTVIGGYALQWRWTGYPGHTLWDWLGMLLPLIFPAVLLPPLLKWVSGNAAGRANAAYQAAIARTVIAAARTSP
jgi:hypothetical protein